MTDLYTALEMCLKEVEQGADVDTVIFRHPEFADELRPILETSVKAKAMAVPVPSEDVLRRNRAKVLQHALELRERRSAPALRRIWSVSLRRALVTFMVVAVLFVSGTGLVRASSATLPGDNLYPVKRTWESLSLFLAFNPERREALEYEYENERLRELSELLASGRSAKVDFAGYVTRQYGTEWRVSGITVFTSSDTRLPDQPVIVGDAVRVRGQTQNGGVAAERIELLPSGSRLPEVEDDELEIEEEKPEDLDEEIEVEPVKPSRTETPVPAPIATATPASTPVRVKVEGSVTSVQNSLIVVNGVVMDLRFADEVKGTPVVGAFAKAEGYYNVSGIFIVIKIEFSAPGSDSGESATPETDNDDNDIDTNVNTNDNDNDDNDSGGGGNSNDDDSDD